MAYSLLLGTLDVHKSIFFHIQKLKHFLVITVMNVVKKMLQSIF